MCAESLESARISEGGRVSIRSDSMLSLRRGAVRGVSSASETGERRGVAAALLRRKTLRVPVE